MLHPLLTGKTVAVIGLGYGSAGEMEQSIFVLVSNLSFTLQASALTAVK